MVKLLTDSTKDKTSAATFQKFLHDQPGLPGGSYWGTNVPKGLGEARHAYSGSPEANGHPYHSGSADAKSNQLTIGRLTGATFTFPVLDPVTRPATPNERPTLENLALALRRVPPPVLAIGRGPSSTQPVTRIVITIVGERREVRQLGPDGVLLRTTFQRVAS